ncbi:hypothetical protein ACQP1P_35445 [Dactylosporangium sp. CA-052675]|uniref:hypothetical protein n=1 Tax=Dactylosporangium sp. CA-052675 TaxID=3239927 RepID=UPI003D8C6719
MTRYAVHDERHELIACWAAGYGETARTVSTLPTDASHFQRLVLAEALTRLSHALWRCYTHPASAMASTAPNTEGWRRQQTRGSFDVVLEAIRTPNLPDDDGTLIVSYDPVEESAHRVGRSLHDINAPSLTAAVGSDVEAELAAVEQAERGDLTGRAQQAVTLTREDISPIQVAAADQLFARHTLGSDDLFLYYDPTAAAVAAAHWLTAAAEVVEDLTGIPASTVVERADRIEALPYPTPTAVLEMVTDRRSPADAVMTLIQEAMSVAEGELPPDSAAADILIDAGANSGESIRLTPLDPQRPARDLLEDLLAGIRGCRLLYEAESDDDGDSFDQAVQERAAADHDRLL